MRAASSDLVDLSGMDSKDFAARTETIAVRWWSDTDVRLRDSPWGPVLSDAPQLEDGGASFSLLWMGHRASDEVTAMLEVARARTFAEFRAAFRGFALPAQNMLYADSEGNIGQVMGGPPAAA